MYHPAQPLCVSRFGFTLQIDVFHIEDVPLVDQYTLMDIAFIFDWRRVSASTGDILISHLSQIPQRKQIGSTNPGTD